MGSTKETPRQKMISIMYLVFISLLALNVSKEVLNAFIVVNESTLITNENLARKMTDIYATFEKRYQLNPNEVKPFWTKAQDVKLLSREMVDYIEKIRTEIISKTEGITIESAKNISIKDLKFKDNYDKPTNYFMGSSGDGSKGKARELKDKINEYRQKMLGMIDSKHRGSMKFGLLTDGIYHDANGKKQNWEQYNFYYTVLAADITILNKFITDVYYTEFDVLNYLLESINSDDFQFDKVEAKVLPKSNYVFIGDDFSAEIIVAAFDTSQYPEVFIMNGSNYVPVFQNENNYGKIFVNIPARAEGIKKYEGYVSVKSGTGDINKYPFSGEYIVAKPTLTVSAIKMNVLYVGIDNPVSISVPGIPRENLVPTISSGTIKPDSKSIDWLVNVPSGPKDAFVNVSTNINGVISKVGSIKFRIKNFPDPIASVANKTDGQINKSILLAAGSVVSKMPNDFEYDISFKVVSFKMSIQRGINVHHFTASSERFTEEMIDQIKITNRGQKIWFENIIVRGPDDIERQLSPIVLTLN